MPYFRKSKVSHRYFFAALMTAIVTTVSSGCRSTGNVPAVADLCALSSSTGWRVAEEAPEIAERLLLLSDADETIDSKLGSISTSRTEVWFARLEKEYAVCRGSLQKESCNQISDVRVAIFQKGESGWFSTGVLSVACTGDARSSP